MTKATWKIIDIGNVPIGSPEIEYDCPRCGRPAMLPVVGLPLAQISGGGVVFDVGEHHMPKIIACRHCRRSFEAE